MKRAAITAVGGYVPDFVMTNDELAKFVDTNDEWITSRTGIKERRVLNIPGKATRFVYNSFSIFSMHPKLFHYFCYSLMR